MVKIKDMPYKEKCAELIDFAEFHENTILPFIQTHLGDPEVDALKLMWQQGVELVSEGASFEEKYETAYSNWVWTVKNSYNYLRKQMGEEGIKKFERAEVDGLKRKNDGPALILFKFIRLFSPGLAFYMLNRKMAYQMQWISPFSVSELNRQRAVFDIPHCKITDFPEADDLCYIGCQSTMPMWIAEQFKVKMGFERQGSSCTCTLTPLK